MRCHCCHVTDLVGSPCERTKNDVSLYRGILSDLVGSPCERRKNAVSLYRGILFSLEDDDWTGHAARKHFAITYTAVMCLLTLLCRNLRCRRCVVCGNGAISVWVVSTVKILIMSKLVEDSSIHYVFGCADTGYLTMADRRNYHEHTVVCSAKIMVYK